MSMERRTLAEGLEISRIVTGLWQIADMERKGPTDVPATAASLEPYAEAGFTTFDMADHYGSAEEVAGALRAARMRSGRDGADIRLLTKWVPEPGPRTPADVRRAVERSRQRLGVDAIDLLQLHAWRYSDPAWLDCVFGLEAVREEGLIRQIGLTNFDTPHLKMVLDTGVDVISNQVSYSLLDDRAAGEMAALCSSRGVHLLAFGVLAGGFLTERWLGAPDPAAEGVDRLDTWSQMKYRRFIEAAGGWDAFQALLRAVHAVARKHGVSMANVACRAILDRPAVAGVIIGARPGRSVHVEDNLRVFDLALDENDRATLAEARAALRPIPGDTGDEYRTPPFLTASGDLSHHVEGFPAPYSTAEDRRGRVRAASGTPWEDFAGYSRAVREGDRVAVSGTTATHGDRLIGGADPASQTHFVIDKIEGAIESLGGHLDDVIRTRVFVSDIAVWESVARAHGKRFAEIRPANTLVRADLIGDSYLVEIEAEAIIRDASDSPPADPGALS